MANGIRTGDPRGFNKGRSSKFREGSRVRQTPEEGRRTYRPKRWGNNNKDEDNSPKNLNDKNNGLLSRRLPVSRLCFVYVRVKVETIILESIISLKSQYDFCFLFVPSQL